MKITVFAKNRKTHEGKAFTSYIGRLTKKDGSDLTVSIKFREECGSPNKNDCPMIIEVSKSQANLSDSTYVDEATGEERKSYTLWVSGWTHVGEYVDNSLDEFED